MPNTLTDGQDCESETDAGSAGEYQKVLQIPSISGGRRQNMKFGRRIRPELLPDGNAGPDSVSVPLGFILHSVV